MFMGALRLPYQRAFLAYSMFFRTVVGILGLIKFINNKVDYIIRDKRRSDFRRASLSPEPTSARNSVNDNRPA